MISRVERTEYNNIDFMKVIMAVLVVAIHTSFSSIIGDVNGQKIIMRVLGISVPFFFVASGFLIWNKIWSSSKEEKLNRLKGWIKKTARLYMWWTLIYLPFTIYGFYKDENLSVLKSVALFFRNFLLVGENYLSWPLWYLLGMLVAGCIIYLMVRWDWKDRTMFLVGLLFALIGASINFCISNGILESITAIYVKLFNSTRNGFFEGLPYILIGVLIASKGVIKSKKILWVIFTVSFLLHMFGYSLADFVVVYSLFSLVIQFDLKRRTDDLYKNFRLTSTVVYFVHMIWVGLITIFIPNIIPPIFLFLLVVILSFATATLVIKNKESQIVKLLFR